MRQIVLDNPPSASTSLLLEKIRKQASSKYRKVKRAAKKAAKQIRKAAKRKRKAAAKKSKPKGKSMARRKSSRKSRRSRSRRRKSAVRSTRRRTRRTRKSTRARRSRRSRSRRRRSSSRIIVVGRRVRVRKGSILNMNPFKIKSLVNRENLVTAGGVVAASIVTRFVATELAKRKIALPLAAQYPTAANAVYNLAIPVLGAALTRRFSPALARGMIFGGLAASISSLITSFNAPKSTAATGRYMREYLDPVRSTGAYLAPRAAASVPVRGMGAYSGFNAWA
jgi:hypothetical protein